MRKSMIITKTRSGYIIEECENYDKDVCVDIIQVIDRVNVYFSSE